jgi:hypothetical protein
VRGWVRRGSEPAPKTTAMSHLSIVTYRAPCRSSPEVCGMYVLHGPQLLLAVECCISRPVICSSLLQLLTVI